MSQIRNNIKNVKSRVLLLARSRKPKQSTTAFQKNKKNPRFRRTPILLTNPRSSHSPTPALLDSPRLRMPPPRGT